MSKDKKFEWNEDLIVEYAKEVARADKLGLPFFKEASLSIFKASHSIDVKMEKHNYKLKRDYNTPEFSFPKGTPVARIGKDYYAVGNQRFSQNQIESFTEWFEPIDVGRDGWEIVEFRIDFLGEKNVRFINWKTNSSNDYLAEVGDHTYYKDLKILLENKAIIYSVLRKIDNSVWTVGENTPDGKIKRFEVYNEYHIRVWLVGNKYLWFHTLCKLPSERKPILKTNDGVDIFAWDAVWILRRDDLNQPPFSRNIDPDHVYPDNIYFSTRDKAIEYVIRHKPVLSVSDILALWCIGGDPRSQLFELAKSKIKL